jgi:hypothetical protein
MFLSSTDFPVPDGPKMDVIRPFGTSKVMSSSSVCEPKGLRHAAQRDDGVTGRDPMPAPHPAVGRPYGENLGGGSGLRGGSP